MSSLPLGSSACTSADISPPTSTRLDTDLCQRPAEALHSLSRAAEYLVDSRMFLGPEAYAGAQRESLQLLRRSSRAIFLDFLVTCSKSV